MTLTQSTLAQMFMLPNVPTEGEAISNMAAAFTNFFSESVVSDFSIKGKTSLETPEQEFRLNAIGLSQDAATSIQNAIVSFWDSAMLLAPSIWVSAPVITPGSGIRPPSVKEIASVLSLAFSANTLARLNAVDSANNLAAAIFPMQLGATVTLAGATTLIPVL